MTSAWSPAKLRCEVHSPQVVSPLPADRPQQGREGGRICQIGAPGQRVPRTVSGHESPLLALAWTTAAQAGTAQRARTGADVLVEPPRTHPE
eukprot:1130068-Prorocentrum_minimum.AAC.1